MKRVDFRFLNHSHCAIDAPPEFLAELRDAFTYDKPGREYMKSYKRGWWDGRIRLFDAETRLLHVGFVRKAAGLARYRGHDVNIDFDIEPAGAADIMEFAANLDTPFPPDKHQAKSIEWAARHRRGAILSPTASGKSFIIYILTMWYLSEMPDKKVLVVVPRTSLADQMASDFKSYGMDVGSLCRVIHSGAEKNTDKPVVISTWQSIHRLGREWFDPFGAVLGDECHQFKAASLVGLMDKCEQAERRIGLTGTLDGVEVNETVLEGLFGPVHRAVTTKQLQEEGRLARLKVVGIRIVHPKPPPRKKYPDELKFITENHDRNLFIVNLAAELDGNTLVLFRFVETHGKVLDALLRSKHPDKTVCYVSGETSAAAREEIRRIADERDGIIIVASQGVFSEGINIRNLHNLIFASPSKSRVRVLQSIGRVLRKQDWGDECTTLFDLADDLPYSSRQYGERCRIYEREGFPLGECVARL